MAVTAADVKALATELASVADATVTTWIAIVERRIDRDAFDGKADDAVTFLAAHFVTLVAQAAAGSSGSKGGVAARKVGDVATTYAAPTVSLGDDALRATMWGQFYLDLREGIFADRRV